MEKIILFISAFGAGGLLTVYLQSLLDRKKRVEETEHDFKLLRYKCIILLMQARLHWDDHKAVMRIHRSDIKSLIDLENELKTELSNALLFAGEAVLMTFSDFLKLHTDATFVKAASAMRKDLWGKCARIKEDVLKVGIDHTS